MAKPEIDYTKCAAEGICINVCPVSVFVKDGDKVVVKNPQDCIGCRACEVSCPHKAIKVLE